MVIGLIAMDAMKGALVDNSGSERAAMPPTGASGTRAGLGTHHDGVVGQLDRILSALKAEFPNAAAIHLEFDGRLRAHVDIRAGENIPAVAARLETWEDGLFTSVTHGSTPHRPFLHRISALIEV
ncbi:hypothetical protein I5E68_14440 [Novosphingobium sp. YJ-S2-02]|uniref:Uncharacterized protein n=2 Tax=Novosphingobium aureum TaxID=2792964 RepID=A0A931HDL6_9SPHN|nr:hypothetical protein [Novosphingobium aureum]